MSQHNVNFAAQKTQESSSFNGNGTFTAAGELAGEAFFAPVSADLVDNLIGRYTLMRSTLTHISEVIRNRMGSYHHPHVAETFAGAPGLSLSAISQRPGQLIFLTPDIHCMENTELTAVYGFLVAALQSMAALHCIKFAVVEPVLTAEGMQYDNA